jgi:FAD/FMN-containing dehydrogenase
MPFATELAADLSGQVIAPDDRRYDAARRVFPGAVDRRPAAIARVAHAPDVARAVKFARERGLELAVRGGGHSPAGHGVSDGGIVLDLAGLRRLQIDPARRVAWAETGLTAGEYTAAAGKHGLATGFGDTRSVGIGGITLSGGIGFLARKHGLTVDSLLSADVVTADGEHVRTDARRHPDLFWAIRGGGGNFGVVTRLQLRLHPVPAVLGGMLILPATADVITRFLEEADAAPEALSTIANVMTAPPLPFLPAEAHGRPVVMAQLAYSGAVDVGERVIGRFRRLATPLADLVRPMPYAEIFGPEPEDYHPVAVARTMFVDDVDRDDAQAIVDALEASSAQMSVTQLRVLGGALARVPVEATAFAHRTSRIFVNVAGVYDRSDERLEHEAWVAGLAARLHDGDTGAYAGFLADEGQDRVRAAYPGATWDRLRAIKRRYDPTNLFRLNQNIPPAAEPAAQAA